MSLTGRVRKLRADERSRWVTMVVAILVGLVAAALHWTGLFLGGALVGLAAVTRRRALLAGLGFGVLVWVVFLATLLASGDLWQYLAMGEIAVVSLVIPVATATFAALVRWLL